MQATLRQEVLDYLQDHNTMTIATCGRDGPWAAAVFYASRSFVFYYLSDPKAKHSRQIAEDPTVALAIHEDYVDWREIRGLQIQGVAERVPEGEETDEAWRLYLAKFPFVSGWPLRLAQQPLIAELARAVPGDAAEVARRLGSVRFYRVTAQLVLYTDNPSGFGHRVEISL